MNASEMKLKNLIENKNFFGIENFIEERNMSRELKNILMRAASAIRSGADF